MKKIKTLLLAFALFIGGITITNAQSKLAHVDTQEIIKTYPAFISAQAQAEKAGNTAAQATANASKAQFEDMVKTYDKKAQEYGAQANTQTKEVNQARQAELEQMKTAIYQEEQRIQGEIQKSAQEAQFNIMSPLQQKIKEAIDKVAKTLGYDYVLEKTTLIVANGKDITAEVKKELGY